MKNSTFSKEAVFAASQSIKERDYWLNKLSGDLVKSTFSQLSERPDVSECLLDTLRFQFPNHIYWELMKLSKNSDHRLHIILVAALVLLLYKYTGNRDIIVGMPIYKQDVEEELILVNTVLALRNQVESHITFKEFLLHVANSIFEANENQNYPIETLLYKLDMPVSGNAFPLFDIAVLLKNIHDKGYLKAIQINTIFSFTRENESLMGELEYNSLLYEKVTTEGIVKHFEHLLSQVLFNLDEPLSCIDIVTSEEKKQLLFEFNNTGVELLENRTIHELFEEQVEKTPGNTAVVYEGQKMTYDQLNQKANRLARALRRKGVGPDTIVGIMIDRSIEMITAVLGVLKAGGAYLPMETELPINRLVSMLDDCQVSLLITVEKMLDKHSFVSLQQGYQLTGLKPHLTEVRQQVKDLNSIQIPDRSLVNYDKYSRYIGLAMCKNGISIQATRGCPYMCAYCDRIWPKTHVYRSAENIFREVELYYNMGVRRFVFIDDIFNLNRQNSTRFFKLIIENKLDVQFFFPTGVRTDLMTFDYIDLMVEAGTTRISLALETASPRLQKLIRKNLDVDILFKNARYFCEKYPQVILELFTMHGFPTETEEEAMETLNFIKSLKWLHFPHLHILKIYPTTDMAKLAIESGITRKAIETSDNLAFHELPDTLPFDKSFTKKYQTEFFNDYFLNRERLLHVLPYQMKVLSEDEIVKDYNSYLPVDITDFPGLLEFFKISREELNINRGLDNEALAVPYLNEKMTRYFPAKKAAKNSLNLLLLDLCQFFSSTTDAFSEIVEPPLGLMYLLTHLYRQFGNKINGKICKSLIDFDSYSQLKSLLDEFKPDAIGIRSLTYYKDFFHKTVGMIRQWGFAGPIIAGGAYATSSYHTVLQDGNIDLVVRGEGEITFAEVIRHIIKNNGNLPGEEVLKNINGIAYIPGKAGLKRKVPREIFIMDAPGWEDADKRENPGHINQSTDLAYVIFTSGSTGKPKAVGVEHKGVANMLAARKIEYKMNPAFISLQLFPYAFDGFITSFFTPLISGAAVILLNDDEILDMKKIKDAITIHQVNHFISIPDFYKLIIENLTKEEVSSLKIVVLAGDRITPAILEITKERNGNIEIVNEYGVTECSVLSTICRNQTSKSTVMIGKPIANTRVYVVDSENRIQPIGVSGELCIGGVGVSRGYLNKPELTAEKFDHDLWDYPDGQEKRKKIPGERVYRSYKSYMSHIYRTGDLARWLPDGNIQYLGRIDHQVKVRGFRIEPGEIENRLLEHESVQEALVIAKEDENGNKNLLAYYVERDEITNQSELWPSVAEFFVFDDLLYYAMTNDELRNKSYKVAINRFARDKVVVDIGTGKDVILSRFCIEAGAKKVYALELVEETYKKAAETIKELGLEEKITLIHGDATKIELPEKVDICLSEIVGPIGGCEGAAVILNKCRHLLKNDGITIPEKSITKIAAIFLPEEIHKHPAFTQTPGEYVKKIFQSLGYSFDLRLCLKKFPGSNVISNLEVFEHLDFSGMIPEESLEEIELVIHKDSRLDGFLVWLTLHTVEDEIIDILENEHCWLPVFIPVFYPGIEVLKGDTIKAECIRTLSKNKINPDYKIKGVLIRENRENIEFEYDLPHFETGYKASPFYRQLFMDDWENYKENPSRKLNIKELREHLSKKLPDYMVPTYFVPLDGIPLTLTGKIDRTALPDPEVRSEEEMVLPKNDIEKNMVEIWKKVLGRDNLGTNENFFMIGGDSIKAVQISSRMNQAGYKVEIKDIFQNPTILKLAPFIKEKVQISDQSVISGVVPLTPIQRWFFQQPSPDRHHFNQAIMLFAKQGFEKEAIERIFLKLQEHHDALRMIYKEENGNIIQVNQGLDYPISLQVFDYRKRNDAIAALETSANEVQASIDLGNGPLMKLALFHLDDGDRLLIVIHHLVIDGVSWRILLEDMGILYQQYKNGEELQLPLKADSFKLWSEKLSGYANSQLVLTEKAYWAELESYAISIEPITKDFAEDSNCLKDTETLFFHLSEEETGLLLSRVHKAFGTETNDILLTALGLAITKTFGNEKMLIALEGHGREKILNDVKIERTVGWFTSFYPVLLDFSYQCKGENLSRQIKEIKETLRRVPNRGIGYGILKYLTAEENKKELDFGLNPQISFNYLGQFDEDVEQEAFAIAAESVGNIVSMERQRETDFDVSGMIANHRLGMSVTYSKKQYKEKTVKTLIDHYKTELSMIISYCANRKEREMTPSDFTYKKLSIETVEQLSLQYGIEDLYPLSPMQEGMLFHALYERNSSAYFEQTSLRLHGELDVFLVERSLNELFKRHDILRTVFVYEGLDRPLQVVLNHRQVDFLYKDLREINEKEIFIREFREKDRQRSFDLSRDVLMRAAVLRIGNAEYEFIWSFHHILMDGWCVGGILTSELFDIYDSYLGHREYQLSPVKPYRIYIEWLESQEKGKSKIFWMKYLEDYVEAALIGTMKLHKAVGEAYKVEAVTTHFDNKTSGCLNELASRNHVTLNTVVQTIWGILLGHYNRTWDVVFGSVVSGRPSEIEGVETIPGLFINTIPVRIRFKKDMQFTDLLQRVQKEALDSEPYHHYPLANIQAESALKQNLLDHILAFENYPLAKQLKGLTKSDNKTDSQGVRLKTSNVETFGQTNYDFNVRIIPGEKLILSISYNGNTFLKETVKRIANHFKRVVSQIIHNEELKIEDIILLSGEEKRQILYGFNKISTKYMEYKAIHEIFAEQAAAAPHHIAAAARHAHLTAQSLRVPRRGWGETDDGAGSRFMEYITYQELNEKSNQLARVLVRKGATRNQTVGLIAGRSIRTIIGIMAILKAGGSYLPLDPKFPELRNLFVIADSDTHLLLTPGHFIHHYKKIQKVFNPGEIIDLDNQDLYSGNSVNLTGENRPGDLAYVLYTSGTSGKPKGVMVEHRNVNYLLSGLNQRVYRNHQGNLNLCLVSPFIFDASVKQIFGALLMGNCLCIVPEETRINGKKLLEFYKKHQVDISDGTPAHIQLLLENEEEIQAGVKSYLIGGESLSREITGDFLNRFEKDAPRIINVYGPTECTVDAASYEITPGNIKGIDTILIGKPLPGCQIYILDSRNQLQPIGVAGELCISGEGVARGYLNRPELTSEKFDHDLWDYLDDQDKSKEIPGERVYRSYKSYMSHIYRTGDLARWQPDGNIQFIARIDHQVKIRGYRIETGEIEAQLRRHEKIKETVVIAREMRITAEGGSANQDKYLCAFVVSEKMPEVSELKEFLSRKLPDYMIPSYFVQIEKIPLTPNGKLARKALPFPGIGDEFTAPRDETEHKLAEIWAGVLGIKIEDIGIDHSFFDLGGHSLNANTTSAKIHKEFNVKLSLVQIFETPTIRELAEYIKESVEDRFASIEPLEKKEYYALSSAQKRLFIVQQMDPETTAYNMSGFIPLFEVTDIVKLERTFRKLINRHESLRTSFHMIADEPMQRIHDHLGFSLEYHNLKKIDQCSVSDLLTHFVRHFDLAQAPLLRVKVIHTPPFHPLNHLPSPAAPTTFQEEPPGSRYILLVDMHHIISDGVSHEILIKDFMALYNKETLSPLRIQYKDFSQWQNSEKEKAYMKQQEKYWLWQFEGEIPELNLPSDYPRPEIQLFEGSALYNELVCDTNALRAIASENGATTFMVFLAIFYIFLSKMSGQDDIVIGTLVAGRRHADLEGIIGFFVNALALRTRPESEKTFIEFLREVRERTVEAFDNQDYQFENLVEKTAVKRDRHNPIFDVLFTCQDQGTDNARDIPGALQDPSSNDLRTSKFDLYLRLVVGNRLVFSFEYSTELFQKDTIEAFARGFKEIVLSVLEDKNVRLKDIRVTTALIDTDFDNLQEELSSMDF
jgi:amino acid adenylation domain-containing protein/non-ribosomal peptide synthase protein (TIGR01720 family)